MESTNNNNNQFMFVYEFKELRKELSAMKKRIDQLEESHEKQQEKIKILESENHTLKTQLNHLNGNKEGEPALKRKRKRSDNDQKKEIELVSTSVSISVSAGKKKTKTNNSNNYEEAVVISQHDNGDNFDSLSDDLLHKIVAFDGSCYSKFGLINKRCKNIYDVEEYKLKKQTCLYGYGSLDMILQHYLQKRKEGTLHDRVRYDIAIAVIYYNHLDAIDWIIQLGDVELLQWLCIVAAFNGRINILSKVFCKCNLTMLDQILHSTDLCRNAARKCKLETLIWLRKYNAEWDANTFAFARENGHDEIVQYLRNEGCPEPPEDVDESADSEQFYSYDD